MRWAIRITRIAGIDINVHVTFVLILGLAALQWSALHGARGAVFGAALMAVLFVCVALHELAHSLVARRYGLKVREIVLLPIGGMAMLGGRPRKPLHELLIALAGPAVNVVIAAALLVASLLAFGAHALTAGGGWNPIAAPSLMTAFAWLFAANAGLALFNMIPALPLDGGRALRAGLAMVMERQRATAIAATIGQAIAALLIVVGVLGGQLLLSVIALVIFFGASQEQATERTSAVLGGVAVSSAYNRNAVTLSPGDRVNDAARHILTSYQRDFAVVHGGELIGVVTRADVVQALSASAGGSYIAGIMRRDVPRADASATLDEITRIMSENSTPVVAVYDSESYLGLISGEDIAEALMLLQFMPSSSDVDRAAPREKPREEWT